MEAIRTPFRSGWILFGMEIRNSEMIFFTYDLIFPFSILCVWAPEDFDDMDIRG